MIQVVFGLGELLDEVGDEAIVGEEVDLDSADDNQEAYDDLQVPFLSDLEVVDLLLSWE
jgi:hypothetical protein